MELKAYSKTDIGKSRTNNEDSHLCDDELGLYIVCDGMGGHAAGETASRKAVEIIHEQIKAERDLIAVKQPEEIKQYLNQLINGACKEIYKLSHTVQNYAGMGTTLTMLLVQGRKAYLGHVGDSRLYLCRSGHLNQLSSDHTLLTAMQEFGGVKLPDAQNSAYANVLTRCVGRNELVQVDTLSFDILPEDKLLLCSDGLTSGFKHIEELSPFFQKQGTAVVEDLVKKALELDGSDNITAVCIEVSPDKAEELYATEVNLRFQTLQSIYMFKNLNFQEAAKVLEIVELHEYLENDLIMKEGESGDLFYMILDGELEVSRNGKILATLGHGSHLGEISFLANESRSASVKALSPVRLMAIKPEDFRALINEDRDLGNKLLWNLAQEIGSKLSKTSAQLAS